MAATALSLPVLVALLGMPHTYHNRRIALGNWQSPAWIAWCKHKRLGYVGPGRSKLPATVDTLLLDKTRHHKRLAIGWRPNFISC